MTGRCGYAAGSIGDFTRGAALTATLISEEADQVVHGFDHRCVVDVPAGLRAGHQTCVGQLFQVEGECGVGDSQFVSNYACSQTIGGILNQQPVDGQSRLLSERGEDRDSLLGLHRWGILGVSY